MGRPGKAPCSTEAGGAGAPGRGVLQSSRRGRLSFPGTGWKAGVSSWRGGSEWSAEPRPAGLVARGREADFILRAMGSDDDTYTLRKSFSLLFGKLGVGVK